MTPKTQNMAPKITEIIRNLGNLGIPALTPKVQKNSERSALYFLSSGMRFCRQSTGIINMTLAFQESEILKNTKLNQK